MSAAARDVAGQLQQAGYPNPPSILVDGNLLPELGFRARAIIKGDSLSLSIAAASILAKQSRDRLMGELAIKYPAYGWEKNAGYGTPAHQHAIAGHGITPHHRRSYAPIKRFLQTGHL
jgi:ribonuclease HII